MSRLFIAPSLLAVLALAACEEKKENKTTTTSAAQTTQPTATLAPSPTAEKKAETPGTREPVLTWKGFSTPESVLYDPTADAYLVSNVNGKPGDADGNGFISKIAPDGKITELKWIEGGKNKVTLNAPKGMAFVDENLYVADIDTVRIFDRKTGAPAGEVKIPGVSFLNDVAVMSDGRVLVSDTGVDGKDFSSKGTDAVWQIDKAKKATPFVKSKDLKGPNGIVVTGDKVFVASFGASQLTELEKTGNIKKGDMKSPAKGQLDGLVLAGEQVFASSWEGKAIYRAKIGGDFETFVENVEAPADIGIDTKRNRLLVPLFNGNEVRAYDIVK